MLKFFILLCAVVLPSAHGLARIVGGHQTTITERSYQVSLQYLLNGRIYHSCGGSIISTKYILTAAHCYPEEGYEDYYYVRTNSTTFHKGGTLYKIMTFIQHPKFHKNILDYDFGLVTLDRPISLGLNVSIIPLTTNDHSRNPVENSFITVSGWGVTSEDEGTLVPYYLRTVDLPVFNRDDCRIIYPYLTSRHTCLGGTPEGMLSSCFGDSGGAGVQNGIQYVIVSGGNSCENPGIPGLYATVSRGRDWIKNITSV